VDEGRPVLEKHLGIQAKNKAKTVPPTTADEISGKATQTCPRHSAFAQKTSENDGYIDHRIKTA
jgi:hypothetical protein